MANTIILEILQTTELLLVVLSLYIRVLLAVYDDI